MNKNSVERFEAVKTKKRASRGRALLCFTMFTAGLLAFSLCAFLTSGGRAVSGTAYAYYVQDSDFTISTQTGWTYGSNGRFNVLTINAPGNYTVGMRYGVEVTTCDSIAVSSGLSNVNLTLNNVKIDQTANSSSDDRYSDDALLHTLDIMNTVL